MISEIALKVNKQNIQLMNRKRCRLEGKLKAVEAFERAADGKATKIIIPSEIQGLAGLAEGVAETVKKTE